MDKWNLPKGPVPAWLDADRECAAASPVLDKHGFVVACVDACLALGCTPAQAAGVTANAVNESAWGQSFRAWNLFGWKCTKAHATAYKTDYGVSPKWWRAPGNKAPGATPEDLKGGDPPWCVYRAFDSLEDALAEWIKHFVPHPDAPAPYGAYRRCGRLFWLGGEWFPELIKAGYKGENTKAKPAGAIAEHKSLVRSARTLWAQHRLAVKVDGAWGPQSWEACKSYQLMKGLPQTGEPDDATLLALAKDPLHG